MSKCSYWQAIEIASAVIAFDGGEFSSSRIDWLSIKNIPLCGKCDECKEHASACPACEEFGPKEELCPHCCGDSLAFSQ